MVGFILLGMSRPVKQYTRLIVYPYRRPGQRTDSWCVATGDRPVDVVYRSNSRDAAERWASRRAAVVEVQS
jgi:hypothetical protein